MQLGGCSKPCSLVIIESVCVSTPSAQAQRARPDDTCKPSSRSSSPGCRTCRQLCGHHTPHANRTPPKPCRSMATPARTERHLGHGQRQEETGTHTWLNDHPERKTSVFITWKAYHWVPVRPRRLRMGTRGGKARPLDPYPFGPKVFSGTRVFNQTLNLWFYMIEYLMAPPTWTYCPSGPSHPASST